jgi:hypothetical protein
MLAGLGGYQKCLMKTKDFLFKAIFGLDQPFLAWIFEYFIQHCFICRPSDFTVSEVARIEPMTIPMAVRCSNDTATSQKGSQKLQIFAGLIAKPLQKWLSAHCANQ